MNVLVILKSIYGIMVLISNNPNKLRFEDINIGDVYTFERRFTQQEVLDFGKLSGDLNPMHIDHEWNDASGFKRNLIHGMLTASLFSTLIGMYCPGENSLYLSQTLKFKKPVYPEDLLTVKGTVIHTNEILRVITLKTEIYKGDEVVVSGEAIAKMREETDE